MQNVRTIVKNRMKALAWTPYKLAMAVKGKVSAPAVYNFVKRGTDLSLRSLTYILHALGLVIVPKESL